VSGGRPNVMHYAPADPTTGNERARCRSGIAKEWKVKDLDEFLKLPDDKRCKLCSAQASSLKTGIPRKQGRFETFSRRPREQ